MKFSLTSAAITATFLHILLIGLFFINYESEVDTPKNNKPLIHATSVDLTKMPGSRQAKEIARQKAEEARKKAELERKKEQERLEKERKKREEEVKRKAEEAKRKAEEAERIKQEQIRIETEKKIALEKKQEEERIAKEKAEKEAKEKAEKERLAKEKAEKEAKEKAEKERLAKEKAEKEAKEKAEKERLAKEKAEKEAKEKAEKERLAKEKAEKEAKEKAKAQEDELLNELGESGPEGDGGGAEQISASYGETVQGLIEQAWIIDSSMNGKKVVVSMQLAANGHIEKTSCKGDKKVCESALRALQAIDTMPAPPKTCPDCRRINVVMIPKI